MPSLHLLIKPASSLCNMRCKYCFYSDVSSSREVKSYGMMENDTLETLVKRAFEYADESVGFAFQGGEPTLAGLAFYERLIALEKKYNTKKIPVYNSIQTNGYAVDDSFAAFFAKHNFLVGLSLDGTKESHDALRVDAEGNGTFGRVLKTAELFQRHGVQFNILCVVNNFVARYPKEVYRQLRRFGYIQFIPCIDPFTGKKARFSLTQERYASFLKKTFDLYYEDFMDGHYVSIRNFDNYIGILLGKAPESCAMNGFCTCYCVVEGDGSVYPCDFYVLDALKLGNIHTDSFHDLLNGQTAKDFVNASLSVSDKCGSCEFYRLCRGGCRRDREPFVDGKPGLNCHCEAYKQFFTGSIEKMLEMAKRIRMNSVNANL